jgi:DNA-binding IclR family transcriptional regulator
VTQPDDSKYVVQVLSRALHVLWSIAEDNRGWTLEELAVHHALNKASMLRILRTLEARDVVLRADDTYFIGPRVLDLSHAYLKRLELDSVARPFMEQLASDTGQTVSLAILDGFEIIYIAFEKAQRELDIQSQIGARHPANATALGKVMLADLDPAALASELHDTPLPRLTHRTIYSVDTLLINLEKVRTQGYALDDEERGIGIRCVAAPIRRSDGRVIAGISIAGAIFHMGDDLIVSHIEYVCKAADAISARFGFDAAKVRDSAVAS